MKIWVDADGCPAMVKDLVIRAAMRLGVPAVFVANKHISVPDSVYVSTVRVGMGPEVVDEYIAQYAEECDFAVTQDIPLASALVPKGVIVINPRGEMYSENNIGERLSIRNFMHDMREAGGITPGPKQFGRKEKQRFSDTLDRELTRCLKREGA
ncbi:MAG: YaiI/YqxD family protein [Pseudomonadota bacterium]